MNFPFTIHKRAAESGRDLIRFTNPRQVGSNLSAAYEPDKRQLVRGLSGYRWAFFVPPLASILHDGPPTESVDRLALCG
jgi:hypothetical protein